MHEQDRVPHRLSGNCACGNSVNVTRSVSEISHVTAPGQAFLIRVASRILWGVESGSVNYLVFTKSLPVTAFRVLAPQVVVLSTANDLVKLQNVVSHAD
jgi:hypothetical protein